MITHIAHHCSANTEVAESPYRVGADSEAVKAVPAATAEEAAPIDPSSMISLYNVFSLLIHLVDKWFYITGQPNL